LRQTDGTGAIRTARQTDRYITFKGIDGDGNSRRLLTLLRRYIDNPASTNPFWEYFKKKLDLVDSAEAKRDRTVDELLLVHAYINNIRELLEEHNDLEALALLEQVEVESC
jgi:hypothetical protein